MRVKGIFRPEDYPPGTDGRRDPAVDELFAHLYPGVADPEIDANHAGTAIVAHNPRLAIHLATISRFMALDLEWSKRTDLRELCVAALNLKLRSAYSFEVRMATAKACGITAEQLAAIPLWQGSSLFDEEQRLVIEYTEAVVAADVPEALFARVRDRFGERGAVEFTSVIALWSAWAMILNAIRP